MFTKKQKINIPADVPENKISEYKKNYKIATNNSSNLMLFAADQKIEHLNDDFFGKGISKDDADPQHFFDIAEKAKIGVLASQFGLISKYGNLYKSIPYLVKLNSKTNLIKKSKKDPYSALLANVEQVVELKKQSKLNIVGVGYTIYLGSEFESQMLATGSQIVHRAHQNGLIAVLWAYPRGKSVKNEKDKHLIAGAVGVAVSLGADFVKINCPHDIKQIKPFFEEVLPASGKTKVICAGGEGVSAKRFLEILYHQMQYGANGVGVGRNIHQRSLKEAIKMCNAIYAIVVKSKTLKQALKIIK